MANVIKLRKGLDINLKGKPANEVTILPASDAYSLVPDDFTGVTPKVVVKEQAHVLAGEPLFVDKNHPEVKFVSPVSGVVTSVERGARRKVMNIIVAPDKEQQYADIGKNDPAALNVEELLYAATLTNDKAEKIAIYKKATEQFANDYRGFNNLGMVYMEEGNVAEAGRCFQNALQIEPNNPDVNYNAGVAAMADGDLKKAEEHLGKAAGTQANLSAAMGTLYTMKGDYKSARGAYGQSATNNAAVQQILAEDYAAAKKTLDAVAEPNATTAYLKAVVAARTNARADVLSNLKNAVAQDASLKAKAANDVEFAKFAEDAEFQAIVK